MIKLFFLFFLLNFSVYASYDQAPPPFLYADGEAVFIDIESANYQITYDVAAKKVSVVSVIKFKNFKTGYPLFDLVSNPTKALLNGSSVTTNTIKDPDRQTYLRVINKKVTAGEYELQLTHPLSTNVIFQDSGVASGFWMSDLTDRRYLEQYLPTNLEFDQYKIKVKVAIINSQDTEHVLKANGEIKDLGKNQFEIDFPSFYTASSMFFHLLPKSSLPENVQFYYRSINGRNIPVDIYSRFGVTAFVQSTKEILAELENDYGPFPHEKLIIYGNAESGGMEYAGATTTSLGSLGHELFHSYTGRGVIPANGNAGWMDEAIARWRDYSYPLYNELTFDRTTIAGASAYARKTDRMSYSEGSEFLSWIAFRMNENGRSLKTFLKDYFKKYGHMTVTTEIFQRELSKAAGIDLSSDFQKYIYGKTSKSRLKMILESEENSHHHLVNLNDLNDLTLPE